MPPRVFDWHDDPTGAFLAAPQIRARFTRYEPGVGYRTYHTHEDAGPHTLRHTVATVLLAEGRPLPEVAALLGHASPATTTSTYAHLLRGGGRAAAETLTRFFGEDGDG